MDYGKLIDDESARKDSPITTAEAQWKREIELLAFFRDVEIELGREMVKANQELRKRGAPTISGPFRPIKEEEKIELAFGTRRPCCRLTLHAPRSHGHAARIAVELYDEMGAEMGRTEFFIDGDVAPAKAFRALVEGFPDLTAEISSTEIAQEIVAAILRGRFA